MFIDNKKKFYHLFIPESFCEWMKSNVCSNVRQGGRAGDDENRNSSSTHKSSRRGSVRRFESFQRHAMGSLWKTQSLSLSLSRSHNLDSMKPSNNSKSFRSLVPIFENLQRWDIASSKSTHTTRSRRTSHITQHPQFPLSHRKLHEMRTHVIAGDWDQKFYFLPCQRAEQETGERETFDTISTLSTTLVFSVNEYQMSEQAGNMRPMAD